jgi:hypothetical protein
MLVSMSTFTTLPSLTAVLVAKSTALVFLVLTRISPDPLTLQPWMTYRKARDPLLLMALWKLDAVVSRCFTTTIWAFLALFALFRPGLACLVPQPLLTFTALPQWA